MKTVKLITCNDAMKAHILQGALENEGIESILHNENFSTSERRSGEGYTCEFGQVLFHLYREIQIFGRYNIFGSSDTFVADGSCLQAVDAGRYLFDGEMAFRIGDATFVQPENHYVNEL